MEEAPGAGGLSVTQRRGVNPGQGTPGCFADRPLVHHESAAHVDGGTVDEAGVPGGQGTPPPLPPPPVGPSGRGGTGRPPCVETTREDCSGVASGCRSDRARWCLRGFRADRRSGRGHGSSLRFRPCRSRRRRFQGTARSARPFEAKLMMRPPPPAATIALPASRLSKKDAFTFTSICRLQASSSTSSRLRRRSTAATLASAHTSPRRSTKDATRSGMTDVSERSNATGR